MASSQIHVHCNRKFNSVRILHVISAPAAGGIEVYVKDLAKESINRGHSAHIAFLEHAEDIGRSTEYQQNFLDELTAAGIKYFFIGHEARKKPWLGMMRVRSYVKTQNIDIYHAHLINGVLLGALINVPRIYTHHSSKMRVGRLAFFLIGSLIDQLIAVSSNCAQMLSVHCQRDVVTILNGVDFRKFETNKPKPRQLGKNIRCISVGRICEDKNFELMVDALALVSSDVRSKLTVSILGEGLVTDTADLKEKIRRKGLEHTIRLLGNRTDVLAHLAEAHIFVMSSAYEGMPIALIEASVAGLPCVVTDVGGCREVVQNCQNGFVVAPGNAQALADAITNLSSDPIAFNRYSKNALQFSTGFSIDRAFANHMTVYRSCISLVAR